MSELLRATLARFDDTLPLDRARTLAAAWYHDREVATAETRHVFGGSWQYVARRDQLERPGQFVTADVAGEPVVVVRGEDGVLRAFANVCRHRAARVLADEAGCVTRLRCRYHGWTYDLAGRLRGTPEFDGVNEFRREDNGLPLLAVEVWGPFVWAHLGPKSSPLLDTIAPLPGSPAETEIAPLRWFARREYRLACNWKIFIDNYLDGGYHVNTVHPGLAGVLDYAHYRTDVHGLTAVQSSPLTASTDGVGGVRAGDRAWYWWVYPNFMLNVYKGVMDANLVLPLGPDACRVIFDFWFQPDADPDFAARSVAVAEQVQAEDVGVCEEVQRGLASRTYDTGRFSVRREAAGYHFHQLLARQLRAGLTAPGEGPV